MQIWVKKKRCRNSVITEPRRLLLLDSVLHLATSFYKKNWKQNNISIIDEQLRPVFELQNLKLIHKNYFDNQYKCIFFYGKHVSRITNVCNKTANDSVRQAVSFQRCSWHLFASLKLMLLALVVVTFNLIIDEWIVCLSHYCTQLRYQHFKSDLTVI